MSRAAVRSSPKPIINFSFFFLSTRSYGVREYACTAIDMIARRLRLAFLNAQAAQEALPVVVDIMGEELNWSKEEKERQVKMATEFLASEMGLAVNRASKDKLPINLSKDEIQMYIKRFKIIDRENKGYVSLIDIRRGLKVCARIPPQSTTYSPILFSYSISVKMMLVARSSMKS